MPSPGDRTMKDEVTVRGYIHPYDPAYPGWRAVFIQDGSGMGHALWSKRCWTLGGQAPGLGGCDGWVAGMLSSAGRVVVGQTEMSLPQEIGLPPIGATNPTRIAAAIRVCPMGTLGVAEALETSIGLVLKLEREVLPVVVYGQHPVIQARGHGGLPRYVSLDALAQSVGRSPLWLSSPTAQEVRGSASPVPNAQASGTRGADIRHLRTP